MNVKHKIKSILPEALINEYKLLKINMKKNRKYSKIEKEINKEYVKVFGKEINWNNPKSYTEKLNVSKVYGANDLKTKLTDKLLVRDWIVNKIGDKYLIPLIGEYDRFEDIKFEELPSKFVIKCNHDSGSVTLCRDKDKINWKNLKKRYNFYLRRSFAYLGYEMHYRNIEPKILIEKYMGDNIKDYKFLCFGGRPYYCWVDSDRFTNHRRNIYDLNWKLQPFRQMTYENSKEPISCPKQFSEMIQIVEKLCKGFDHVRVDLYVVQNKIYFGEMTFTNGNGFERIYPDEWNDKLGELWTLDSNIKN